MKVFLLSLACWVGIAGATQAACNERKLEKLIGFTITDITEVGDSFEGSDFDTPIKLENGMVFVFNDYNYSYSFNPAVIVAVKRATRAELLAAGVPNPPSQGFERYRLLIDCQVYDVERVR